MSANRNSFKTTEEILIVDDELANLQLLSELLSKAGYVVRPTRDPQLAIESAMARQPDMILLDVRMPEVDGFEVCGLLKQDERTRDVPVLFVSALTNLEDRIRCFDVGGVDFISKPYQEPEVLARVRTHLDLHKLNLHLEDLVTKRTEELYENQLRLRAMASELIFAEERERKRISTELHDGAAQSLTVARMQLAEATEAVKGSAAEIVLDEASQQVRQSLEQIRGVLLDLSSPTLHQMGLSAGLSEWLDDNIRDKHGLKTVFHDECGDVPLAKEMRLLLFRNVCELLTNVIKHGQAQKVSVNMTCDWQTLQIVVEDDGVGFDSSSVSTLPDRHGGFGLFSVSERMADMGGSLEMVSAPGKGCKAILVAPLESTGEGGSQ
jgi:two-component system sensor histidine kinase/response regulator